MFKKTALALTLAGVAAAPFAAQADTGPTLYGRMDLGLHWVETATDTTADLNGSLSRFGIKGDEDLGGGTSMFYKFEFRVLADDTTIPASNRLSYLGFKSGIGSVSAGRQWSAYYNHVGTHVDPTEVVGTAYLPTYLDRISNIVKYANSFGPVSVELDVMVDGAGGTGGRNGVDRKTLGVSFAGGPVTVGVGFDTFYNGSTNNQTTDTLGVAGGFKLGSAFTLRAGYEKMDNGTNDDTVAINVGALFTAGKFSVMGGVGTVEDDDTAQEDKVYWLHLNQDISKRTRVYFEYRNDSPDVGSDTKTARLAASTSF